MNVFNEKIEVVSNIFFVMKFLMVLFFVIEGWSLLYLVIDEN